MLVPLDLKKTASCINIVVVEAGSTMQHRCLPSWAATMLAKGGKFVRVGGVTLMAGVTMVIREEMREVDTFWSSKAIG